MGDLQNRLKVDMVTAMKAKDAVRRDLIRALMTAIRNSEIDQGKILDDVGITGVLQKQLKQRRESAAAYVDRPELAKKENEEAGIIETYLPAKLSDQELTVLVDEAIVTTGASGMSDMGKVMGMVSAKAAGRADGSVVASLVKERLA